MKAGVTYELSLRAPWVWARGICFSVEEAKSRSLARRGEPVMTNVTKCNSVVQASLLRIVNYIDTPATRMNRPSLKKCHYERPGFGREESAVRRKRQKADPSLAAASS